MVERYRAGWPEGLLSKSRRPHLSPARKVSEQERAWIAELRQRGLGLLCIEVEQTESGFDRLHFGVPQRTLFESTAIAE
jgi:hypothetical protein